MSNCTLPSRGRTPGWTGGAPLRVPTHLLRPGSVSGRLPVAALLTATTPLLRSPSKSNHIQASKCRSPCSRRAQGSTALAPSRSSGGRLGCRAASRTRGTRQMLLSARPPPNLLTPTRPTSWLTPAFLERREKNGDAEELGLFREQSRCCLLTLFTCSARLLAGPESGPVTYTVNLVPWPSATRNPAAEAVQPPPAPLLHTRQSLRKGHPAPEGLPLPPSLQLIKLRESRPLTQGDSNSQPLQVGTPWRRRRRWLRLRNGPDPRPWCPAVPAECPNFPVGPAVTRALPTRRTVGHRSHPRPRTGGGRSEGSPGPSAWARQAATAAQPNRAGVAATTCRPPRSTLAPRRPGGYLTSGPQPTSIRHPAPSARTLPSSRPPPRFPGPFLPPPAAVNAK
nr:nascent polypeptide-associated complex subunit alpha, muscle-specific form [Loxodonta africana]